MIRTTALLVAIALAAAAWWHFHVPSTYFPASELEHPAAPLRRIDLDFPESRPGIDWYGKLRMNVFIDHEGRVNRVEVLESTVPPSFTDYAVRTFQQTRFEPAQRAGRAVKSVKKVEVEFRPPVVPKLTPSR